MAFRRVSIHDKCCYKYNISVFPPKYTHRGGGRSEGGGEWGNNSMLRYKGPAPLPQFRKGAILALEFCKGTAQATASPFKLPSVSSERMLTPLCPHSLTGVPHGSPISFLHASLHL